MRSKTLVVLAVIAVAVAACGSSSRRLEDKLQVNTDPDSVLLMIANSGGFVPVDFQVGQGPYLVLLRDGTLVTEGPQIEIYPGPLLTKYQTSQLDEESLLFVLEELDAIGFTEIENETNDDAASMVADAPNTIVTFYNQSGAHVFSVYALGISDQVKDARVPILANLVNRLGEMGFGTVTGPYQADSIQVVAGPIRGDIDPTVANTQPWPLPRPFSEMADFGFDWRCATYQGDEAAGLLDVFEEANQATTWDQAGTEYQMKVRPLFPGEEPCKPIA